MDIREIMAIGIVMMIIASMPLIPIAVLIHLLSPTTFWQILATLGVMMILYTILLSICGCIVAALLTS